MQNLWNRVAQVRSSCRCALCNPVNGGVARRPTSFPPLKRRNLQGDFFLVFSSTIAFEAVVWDSVKKKERSDQWDRVLAQERERVATVENDQRKRIDRLLANIESRRAGTHFSKGQDGGKKITCQRADLKEESEWQQQYLPARAPLRALRRPRLSMTRDSLAPEHNVFFRTSFSVNRSTRERGGANKFLRWDWEGVFAWASRCDELREASGFQHWKGMPLNWLMTLDPIELNALSSSKKLQLWYYGGPSCEELEPDPLTEAPSLKKLRTLEWSILKMIMLLRDRCVNIKGRTTAQRQVDTTRLDTLLGISSDRDVALLMDRTNAVLYNLAWKLRASDVCKSFESPRRPQYSWTGDSDLDRFETIKQLYFALQDLHSKDRTWPCIIHCCEILLSSTTAPNVHAFNMLLVRLCQVQDHDLVSIVIKSMQETHMRPNEITHATLLRYFTLQGNRTAFSCYLDQMHGLRNGLAIIDKRRPINPLVERQTRAFGEGGKKIAILARKNQEVYTALIVGILRFYEPKDAMFWYRGMISEGWQPSRELLLAILKSCFFKRDWFGGLAVWRAFAYARFERTARVHQWMVALCRACGQEEAYNQILGEGTQLGFLTSSTLETSSDLNRKDAIPVSNQDETSRSLRLKSDQIPISALVEDQPDVGQSVQAEELITEPPPSQELANSPSQRFHYLNTIAKRYAALKRTRARLALTLNQISYDIFDTTEEIINGVPMAENTVFKYRVSVLFEESLPQSSIDFTKSLYEEFSASATMSLEQASDDAPPAPSPPRGSKKAEQPRTTIPQAWEMTDREIARRVRPSLPHWRRPTTDHIELDEYSPVAIAAA